MATRRREDIPKLRREMFEVWRLDRAGIDKTEIGRRLNRPRQTIQDICLRIEELGDAWFEAEAKHVDKPRVKVQAPARHVGPLPLDFTRLTMLLRREPISEAKLLERLGCAPEALAEALQGLSVSHTLIESSGVYSIQPQPLPASEAGHSMVLTSDEKGWHRFGVTADNHLGSKQERLDVLNDLYDIFAEEGIDTVFNCGNFIDGEARFNRTELKVHGIDSQCRHLARHYPRRDGISTFAVWGDDHEGWYAQREGLDVGRHVERIMHDEGRDDWHDLGFMEAHITLQHPETGASSTMAVVHPGGGTAYADSYAVQKILESLDGGEKPAIWLGGHYHKMVSGNYRSVWWALIGSTQGQTIFMRKKKIRSVLGGAIIECRQDPFTGAIPRFKIDQMHYYNRGYYEDRNNRWSHSGPVEQAEVGLNAP